MKLFPKLLITALVLAVLAPFTVLKGKDGRPLMSLGNLKMPELSIPDMPEVLPAGKPGATAAKDASGNDLVYKWTDAEGNLHFSNTPPGDGSEYSVKGYDPQMNLIQSVKPKPEPVDNPAVAKADPQQPPQKIEIGSPYSPEKIGKLIEDAQNVQQLLNDRIKQQEALTGR